MHHRLSDIVKVYVKTYLTCVIVALFFDTILKFFQDFNLSKSKRRYAFYLCVISNRYSLQYKRIGHRNVANVYNNVENKKFSPMEFRK